MKMLTNHLKGKMISTQGYTEKVLCSSRYDDVIIKHDGKYKCIKNGEYIIMD